MPGSHCHLGGTRPSRPHAPRTPAPRSTPAHQDGGHQRLHYVQAGQPAACPSSCHRRPPGEGVPRACGADPRDPQHAVSWSPRGAPACGYAPWEFCAHGTRAHDASAAEAPVNGRVGNRSAGRPARGHRRMRRKTRIRPVSTLPAAHEPCSAVLHASATLGGVAAHQGGLHGRGHVGGYCHMGGATVSRGWVASHAVPRLFALWPSVIRSSWAHWHVDGRLNARGRN